jgi:hypothetical protein
MSAVVTTKEFQTGRFHDGERWLCVLYRRGCTRLHLTYRDDPGIRHTAVPLQDERYLRPLPLHAGDYPVERMVRRLRAIAHRTHITESAKAELDAAVAAPERGP